MTRYNLKFRAYGERSILIEWPQEINNNILKSILNFKEVLKKHYIKEKVYIKYAYNSILVSYNHTIDNIYDNITQLETLYSKCIELKNDSYYLWKIPVCYDAEFGLDLEEISVQNMLSKQQIIELHSSKKYTVYFCGFLPGFLYLGGLDKKLYYPRKSNPILQVKKGAVAIGGHQTGIYPNASPGGWNSIGNTPLNFFDVNKSEPCFAKAGDRIKFYPVTKQEYDKIIVEVKNNNFSIESEVLYD